MKSVNQKFKVIQNSCVFYQFLAISIHFDLNLTLIFLPIDLIYFPIINNNNNNNNFPFETKMGIIKTKMCLLNRCHSMIPKSGGECACG